MTVSSYVKQTWLTPYSTCLCTSSMRYHKLQSAHFSTLYFSSVFQVKDAYIYFLIHCYVDTEVEMKEVYTSHHIWALFDNFLLDMARVSFKGGEKFGILVEWELANFFLVETYHKNVRTFYQPNYCFHTQPKWELIHSSRIRIALENNDASRKR